MNIAICDDEPEICQQLNMLIHQENGIDAVDAFSNADSLLASNKQYDLLYLDIQMPGINGLEAARLLRKDDKSICIVFITSAKEFVFDAFDVGAFHYLVKPINPEKFSEVFDRARSEIISQKATQEGKILIRTRSSSDTINVSEILYAESQLKKLIIHTKDREVEYYGSLGNLGQQLGESFFRCHRGYLVNMAYILQYSSDTITLQNKEQIYLSKQRYADFVKAYMHYLKDGGACFV